MRLMSSASSAEWSGAGSPNIHAGRQSSAYLPSPTIQSPAAYLGSPNIHSAGRQSSQAAYLGAPRAAGEGGSSEWSQSRGQQANRTGSTFGRSVSTFGIRVSLMFGISKNKDGATQVVT
eukprot:CAMPEP_0181291584 /NCGR_PEP_ID=MMETSP1101-20121128/2046_1 /TAXON_ID=46948 /ORGANISM="Rhodomonas abbreviata, Strain Caron Lab Isolate" /LENGTH=118 /DNA_ID=CAMNT_0023395987 /DNA_START=56 /DNA_END=412 /DNA_ORIENTATION=+